MIFPVLVLLIFLQRGKGVDVNHKLSLELFRRAAELGDAEAQGAMAMRMAFGLHHSNSFEGSSVRHFGRVGVG
jgi:TPR repeat protein